MRFIILSVETRVNIEITEKRTAEDRRVLTTWREHVFSPKGLGTDCDGGKLHILAASDGAAAGHIGFDICTLLIDGKESNCIGGGAVVVPEHQDRVLPKRMFYTSSEWRDKTYSGILLALFCTDSLVGYYKKHHFIKCATDAFYIQKDIYQKSKFAFMTDRPIHGIDRMYIPSKPW